MMSSNVKSWITSIPLNKTIEITLERIYDRKEINTDIPKTIIKEMLLLCIMDVHFLFEDEIYQQTDGAVRGSPLGPILADIFMVELETTIVPILGNLLHKSKRYVDDIHCVVKTDSVNEILLKLNSLHINIQFSYEAESNNMLPFLDILVIRKNNNIKTTFYRKSTNNDIYLNCFHLNLGNEVR